MYVCKNIFCCLVLLLTSSMFLLVSHRAWDGTLPTPVPVPVALSRSVECDKKPCDGGPEETQPHKFDTSSENQMTSANLQQIVSQLDPSSQLGHSTQQDTSPQLEPSPKQSTPPQLDPSPRPMDPSPQQSTPPQLDPSPRPMDPSPQLDPLYRNTMAKLGSDLEFDTTSQCPEGSYMRNRTQHSPPQHTDCPTLFLVGVRKGGTTSLYNYVSKHPDFHGVKLGVGDKEGSGELHYFNKRKLGSWNSYRSKFAAAGNKSMTGEASVTYLPIGPVPKRLYTACGKQAKVVMLLRDPVKRMESDFLFNVRISGSESWKKRHISTTVKSGISTYVSKKNRKNLQGTPQEWSRLVGLLDPYWNMIFDGIYYIHLLNWLCNFPAENILILNSEEFYEHPGKILDIVFQFLGLTRLDPGTYESITSTVYNKGKYEVPAYQRLNHTDIESMMEVFKPFNKALLELLQWDNHKWLMD